MSLHADVRVTRGTFTLDCRVDVEPGQVVAVLGPNGAGKTTLLHAVSGLAGLADGEVTVDGVTWARPGHTLPAHERACGLLAADHLLFPHLSALDNVAFGPRARGSDRQSADARAHEELQRLGVDALARRRPRQLSHGQGQRVALARALATDPRVLLLDEPLAALDPAARPEIRAGLAARLRDFPGMTLLVTHDPLDALTLAHQLVFLRDGTIAQSGPPADIVSRPRDPYVAQVAGLNLYAARSGSGGELTIGDSLAVVSTATLPPGPAWVSFAPTAVAIYPDRPSGSPRNAWPGRVESIELTGQTARVRLVGTLDLVADITLASLAELSLAPGSSVWASVKATEISAYPA